MIAVLAKNVLERNKSAFFARFPFPSVVLFSSACLTWFQISHPTVNQSNERDWLPVACGFLWFSFSYGGLLLYFCDRSVSKQFLDQFKFAPRSRLCLVCQDRNTLRQEVARLDLEEHWRFRLRDELQTANSPDEPALYFLTGKHDDWQKEKFPITESAWISPRSSLREPLRDTRSSDDSSKILRMFQAKSSVNS